MAVNTIILLTIAIVLCIVASYNKFSVCPEEYMIPSCRPKYKGQLTGFPEEVVDRMLYYQEQQTGKKDITIFENKTSASKSDGGFTWEYTKEGPDFWYNVLINKHFNLIE